jgi:hypothetical protein
MNIKKEAFIWMSDAMSQRESWKIELSSLYEENRNELSDSFQKTHWRVNEAEKWMGERSIKIQLELKTIASSERQQVHLINWALIKGSEKKEELRKDTLKIV